MEMSILLFIITKSNEGIKSLTRMLLGLIIVKYVRPEYG